MALNDSSLAQLIKDALGFSAEPTSSENEKLAKAIVDHLKTGIVSHLPGTVSGNAPPSGGPLTDGAAVGGVIALSATLPVFLSDLALAFGTSTPEIVGMGTAISQYVQVSGSADFSTGSITGACSNTPVNPGALVAGGANGAITGLSGSDLATSMASLMTKPGTTPELIAMCTAITDHIEGSAVLTYAPGTVIGTCSAGGGPIIAGAGAGGSIA